MYNLKVAYYHYLVHDGRRSATGNFREENRPMAHNIDQTTGEAAIAFVGETPWHGLGSRVEETATIEEIKKAARLGWNVNLSPVQYVDADGQRRTIKHNVLYRDDTNEMLTIVGPEYKPFQNDQVLDFFKHYVEAGDMSIHTAGALNGGRIVWALAKMKASYLLDNVDQVDGYVLLMNPHVYGKGAIAKLTEVRVVCNNTLTMALGGRGSEIKLWHNKEFSVDRQDEVKSRLGIAHEKFNVLSEQAKKLAAAKLDAQAVIEMALATLAPRKANEELDLEEMPRSVQTVVELWQGAGKGSKLPSSDGTAWGAFNAVTEFVDWHRGRSSNARLTYAWLGNGETVKHKARTHLLDLIGAN